MKQAKGINPIVEKYVVGPMEVNSYVLADPDTKDACVIDPGASPGKIKDYLEANGLNLKFIINTHGHGDHIAANGYLGVPVYIHRLDEDFLTDPAKNLSGFFGFLIKSPRAGRLLEDKDRIVLGNLSLEIIHTPGHTPGSVSIKAGDIVFTGDALFRGGIGRTDFDYGDEELLVRSIKEKLLTLDDKTVVHPGHGDSSTIGEERDSNPFL